MAIYATVAELKDRVEWSGADEKDDLFAALLEGASRTIDGLCNRSTGFITASATRTFAGNGKQSMLLDHDFTSISALAVKGSPTDTTYTTWSASDFLVFSGSAQRPDFNETPFNGIMVAPGASYSVFTDGRFRNLNGFRPDPDTEEEITVPTVQITAMWGYADDTAPPPIREATVVLAARWYKRGQGVWDDSLVNDQVGIMMYRQKLDPDAALMTKLARYIKPVY